MRGGLYLEEVCYIEECCLCDIDVLTLNEICTQDHLMAYRRERIPY